MHKQKWNFLTCYLFSILFSNLTLAQDSVIFIWNDIVNSGQADEAQILQMAHVAKLEINLFKFYIGNCQEYQPEAELTFNNHKSRIDEIGAGVFEFLTRYTEEEIASSGIDLQRALQENYDMQVKDTASNWPTMENELQKEICSEIRNGLYTEIEPTISVLMKR